MRHYNNNPLLLSIPESFESSRLHIRAPQWGDGAKLNEAVRESENELKPWMPWAQAMPTIEESEVVIRKSRSKYMDRSDLMLLLF